MVFKFDGFGLFRVLNVKISYIFQLVSIRAFTNKYVFFSILLINYYENM